MVDACCSRVVLPYDGGLVRVEAPVDGELALCVLYGLNGIHVDVADDDAHTLIIALACGQLDYRDVATRLEAWLANTKRVAARSRRPIKP